MGRLEWEWVDWSGSGWLGVGVGGSKWEWVGWSGGGWLEVGVGRLEWEWVARSGSGWLEVGFQFWPRIFDADTPGGIPGVSRNGGRRVEAGRGCRGRGMSASIFVIFFLE